MADCPGLILRSLSCAFQTAYYASHINKRMSTPEEVFEELNFPSAQKLKRVLDDRKIAYDKKDVERLVKREAVRQVQAPSYKFEGRIAANGINDRLMLIERAFDTVPHL